MRIFLCGAQGTGKSTLVLGLPNEYGLKKKDSFSREFLDKDPTIQTRMSEGYKEFQDKIVLYCLDEYVNDDDFISSRSIIDTLAYLRANKADATIPLTNMINHFSEYIMTENDIYIYLPIEFPLSNHGNKTRDTDKEYQVEVDSNMYHYFKRFRGLDSKAQFIEINGSIESRLKQLINIIKEKRNV